MAVKASFYNYNLHTSVWWAYHYNNIQHQTVTWIFSSVITLLVSTKASHELLSWKVIGQSILLLNINTFLLSLCRGSIWWIISSNMPGLKWLPPECKIGILKTRSGFWKKKYVFNKKKSISTYLSMYWWYFPLMVIKLWWIMNLQLAFSMTSIQI